jgi:hypothetical protein
MNNKSEMSFAFLNQERVRSSKIYNQGIGTTSFYSMKNCKEPPTPMKNDKIKIKKFTRKKISETFGKKDRWKKLKRKQKTKSYNKT